MTSRGLLASQAVTDDHGGRTRYIYRVPGAYVEFPRARQAISSRRTDITGFVGIASRGPVGHPIRIESWGEFVTTFGAHFVSGYLAYAVEAFFANGGVTAWVVRVADGQSTMPASLDLVDQRGRPTVRLTAATGLTADGSALASPGTWAHRMTAAIARDGERFDLTLRGPDGLSELWRNLAMGGSRSVAEVVNDVRSGSRLVTARLLAEPVAGISTSPAPGGPFAFSGGSEGIEALSTDDVIAGIGALERIDEIGLLAVPDLQPVPKVDLITLPPDFTCEHLEDASDGEVGASIDQPEFPPPLDVRRGQAEMIAQCERTRDRFAILDSPWPADDPSEALVWKHGLRDSSYAAVYFPWLKMPDPLRPGGRLVRSVPPSGHLAGIYAAGDRSVGVQKAPANEEIELVADVSFRVDDATHGTANDSCLNVVRPYEGRGIRVAGARTLACRTPWRFINVRRLVAMVEEAIAEDLAWTVFEPNSDELWSEVDRQVRGFLDSLWRDGMLDGATAQEAFDVRCDAETNPEDQVQLGRVVCLIALRPPPPAEFVVLRVTLSAEGSEAVLVEAADG